MGMCTWEFMQPGDVISEDEFSIDYCYLKKLFIDSRFTEHLMLQANDISFSHALGKGIQKFSLNINSGTLVGVLGREGTGKSTILNLLAGEIPPATGDIMINGYSYRRELYHLKGMIGFVPEDDLLFDELSVFDNLYYTAKLYLGNLSEDEIRKKVRALLKDLDLWRFNKKIVGSLNDKNLQPGQRRLLNIALELIRDPQLLIVDNALSALSLSDSSRIIEVLSDYTFKGRIVVTTITQTDTEKFQYFDRLLLLGEGGLPLSYQSVRKTAETLSVAFGLKKKISDQPVPNEILELLDPASEGKGISDQERYKKTDELYTMFRQSYTSETQVAVRKILPEKILKPPTLYRQYIIFNLRNFKTKLARTRELIITLIASPLLALFISLVLRGNSTTSYSFYTNRNIPEYFFISFIIAIFLGMVLSAREIFRERKINEKQAYLNISKFSYINSKISYLLALVFFQSLFYVSISHALLKISGMFYFHWLVFFSCGAFGILTGLLMSENHSRLEDIYSRTIPLIILFQLIFGGGFIRLDSLPGSRKYTPLISDLMTSRWAYEAAMVYQFRTNDYNRFFYDLDRKISTGFVNSFYIIPELKEDVEYCRSNYRTQPDTVTYLLNAMGTRLKYYAQHFDVFPYENINLLRAKSFSEELADDLSEYIEYLDLHFLSLYQNTEAEKNQYEQFLDDSLGSNYLQTLKMRCMNRAVNSEVTNANAENIVRAGEKPPLQLIDQVYQYPVSDLGRAGFFLPEKKINGQIIDTVEFNISIIWLINLLIYVALVTGVIEKIRK